MYFSGIDSRQHEATIKSILKSYLEFGLSEEPYLSDFSRYGGVDVAYRGEAVGAVVGDDDTGVKPYLELSKQTVEDERWGKVIDGQFYPGIRYLWSFSATANSNDFSGGQVGAENPVPSNILLSDALFYLISSPEGYEYMASLGLEEADIQAGEEEVDDGEDSIGGRRSSFTITFTTHSLPTYIEPEPEPIGFEAHFRVVEALDEQDSSPEAEVDSDLI